ncbi:MAG: hypothetical protein JWQ23_3451 [Herminiimonas sp.]|nr:hypothetical protein [Herminiimonas sp.]
MTWLDDESSLRKKTPPMTGGYPREKGNKKGKNGFD